MRYAYAYGADTAYIGLKKFSLRVKADNFYGEEYNEIKQLKAQYPDKRLFCALNIAFHNKDIDNFLADLDFFRQYPIDAFIVSDPGVISLIWEAMPDAEIHLSTQANTTNYITANYWAKQGVKRIVSAREMSLSELKTMHDNLPEDIEIESFIHGAMCISYSGRCLLSNYMVGRDANRGACTHPCRWKYALVEQQRPGEYFPIEEDSRGSYIMNSRDLCMIDCIPDLVEAGITSFKIEGRMKSMYYVATIVSAYRMAIDAYLEDPENYVFDPKWYDELCKASHREFTHGFYYNKPTDKDQNYLTSDYTRTHSFVGLVKVEDDGTGYTVVEQRNKFSVGDEIEIFGPGTPYYTEIIKDMTDEEGNPIESAPHPQQVLRIRFERKPKENFILRKKKPEC